MASDEKRRHARHERQMLLAGWSYAIGVVMLLAATLLAFRFSGQLWDVRCEFTERSSDTAHLAELRLFLISFMSFKATFVAGLFTTGGLLLKGAKGAVQPQPYPPQMGPGSG